MSKSDHKPPKKTKAQEDFEKHLVAYFDEKLLNVVMQLRAICIAQEILPEKFWNAFVNDTAQDDFYVKLHVAQDNYNLEKQKEINAEKAQKQPPKVQISEEQPNG